MDNRCPNCGAKLAPNLVAAIKDPAQDEKCYEPKGIGVLDKTSYQH